MAFPTNYDSLARVSAGGTAVDTDVNQTMTPLENLEHVVGLSGDAPAASGTHEARLGYLGTVAGTAAGTPALTWGTANLPGTVAGRVGLGDTLAVFGTAVPAPVTAGGAGSAGTVALAARLDHVHASSAPTFGTPALTFGTANADGTATSGIRADATVLAFSSAVASTLTYGTATAGTATTAARRDHGHAPFAGGSVATSGTVGYLYLPVTGGTPSGTPALLSGVGVGTAAALVYDNVNGKAWAHAGTAGGWTQLGGATGTAGGDLVGTFPNPTVSPYLNRAMAINKATTPDAAAALEVAGTAGGLLVPRLTTTQRNALTAPDGLLIYNSTNTQFEFRESSAWHFGFGAGSFSGNATSLQGVAVGTATPASTNVLTYDGSQWAPATAGGGGFGQLSPLVVPSTSILTTWVNQGSSTVTDESDGLYLEGPAAAGFGDLHCRVHALTTGRKTTLGFQPMLVSVNFGTLGIVLTDGTTAGSKALTFGFRFNSGWEWSTAQWATVNASSATATGSATAITMGPLTWLQIDDTGGTNFLFRISTDGVHWVTARSEARTAHLTATHVGIFVTSNGSSAILGLKALHWSHV